ncbi:MAG: sigma-70 family RNA polymerase sigma factor [Candidatus Zixiibacteriota bacterium]
MDCITPIILSVCRKNRLSREESCDVFGQVSYKLLKNLKNIKSAAKLFNYVGTIAARESVNIFRRAKLDEKAVEQIYRTIYDFKPPAPDEIYAYSRRLEIINRAMMRLPDREYRLLKAMYLEEGANSYKEIAERLEMPVSSIGPTRARGLLKLYKMLKETRDFL